MVLLVVFLFFVTKNAVFSLEDNTKSLKYFLLRSYDPMVRPIGRNGTTEITLALNLYQIIDMNERAETVTLYIWNRQMWYDKNLGWDPQKFGGLDKIDLRYNQIWRPDTYVYNGVHAAESFTNVLIHTVPASEDVQAPPSRSEFTGSVRFMFPGIYPFSCEFEVRYFPFDQQNCTLYFGSWVHDSSEILFSPDSSSVRNETYLRSEEWTLVSFHMVEQKRWYNCCSSPFSEIHCHLVVKRKPLYYIVNLIIPTIVISVIAAFGFFMPVSSSGERTEKVNLGVTTLLAMAVLLVVVSDHMPVASNFVPLISWFYLANIFLTALGTVLSSTMIIIQQSGHLGKEVPSCVHKVFFEYLGPMVGMTPPLLWKNELMGRKRRGYGLRRKSEDKGVLRQRKEEHRSMDNLESQAFGHKPLKTYHGKLSLQMPDNDNTWAQLKTAMEKNNSYVEEGFQAVCKELRLLGALLRPMKESVQMSDRDRAIMAEWEFIAHVLDKVFLVLFMIAIFAIVCSLKCSTRAMMKCLLTKEATTEAQCRMEHHLSKSDLSTLDRCKKFAQEKYKSDVNILLSIKNDMDTCLANSDAPFPMSSATDNVDKRDVAQDYVTCVQNGMRTSFNTCIRPMYQCQSIKSCVLYGRIKAKVRKLEQLGHRGINTIRSCIQHSGTVSGINRGFNHIIAICVTALLIIKIST